MKATDKLLAEHGDIRQMLLILEEIQEKLAIHSEFNIEHMDRVLDFLKTFVDKGHFGKEEDVLLPALELTGVPAHKGPIGAVLEDHKMARFFVKELTEAVMAYKNGNKNATASIVKNSESYIQLMNMHMRSEEQEIYSLANRRISDRKQDDLLKKFEKLESKKLGEGKHDEYRREIFELSEIYLESMTLESEREETGPVFPS